MKAKVEIFFSYAHEDELLRQELEKQLSILKWQGFITSWYDREISAGEEWAHMIDVHLDTAHIILLMISPDFMASHYCYGKEMKRALERHDAGEARVIPVILRPVYWSDAPFSKLQVLPSGGVPVTSWQNRDEAFYDVARGIRGVVEELRAGSLIRLTAPQRVQDILEKPADSNLLYNALLTLNYHEQVTVFRQFIGTRHRIGAFVIHGEPSYGQNWLLNRLAKVIPGSSAGTVFRFSFQRKACGRSLEALWRELANWVGLKDSHSPQKIAEQVHQLWQTQTVILVMHKLDQIDEQYMNEFVQKFWLQLVRKALDAPSQLPNGYLLMFLVDDDGCVDKWNITLAEQFSPAWKPHIPIRLSKLTHFSSEVVTRWIEHELDTLPSTLAVQDILENNEGIPELVLERICDLCGCDWFEREKAWMKY